MDTRGNPHDPDDDDLPQQAIRAVRRLAAPPRALPDLVDARIRDAIARHEFRLRRRASWTPALRWAAAAAIAIAAGGALGWTSAVKPLPSHRSLPVPDPMASDGSSLTTRITIVDALLAARIAEGARHGPSDPDSLPDAALLARLDVDHDGVITLADARLLSHRAVQVPMQEGGS